MSFNIGKHTVGEGRCFIIGEVGLAHDGSLQAAHAFVDAIAQAGADAVKFQCHLAEHEPDAPMRCPTDQYFSRHQQWRRTAFSEAEWSRLQRHATKRGLEFLCSPFSVEAVRLLDPLVPAWKIPSGEITNKELLKACRATDKPLLFSTGMATKREYYESVNSVFRGSWDRSPMAVLHCTSLYPCPPEKIGLEFFAEDMERGAGSWARGLSDHSGTIYPGLAAVTLGCDVLEVHVKLSQYDHGPDASSSITPEQLKQLVEGVRFIETMKANPVDKDAMASELEPMRELFMRKAALA